MTAGTSTNLPAPTAPVGQIKTNRSLAAFVLLGIVTLGIYQIAVLTGVGNAINTIANRYDGRRTMHYCLLFFIIGPITFGIAYLVWFNSISGRIGNELQRRGHERRVSASDFWLWDVLGSFIIVGPFIYSWKLLHATNELAADYNQRG